MHEKKPYGSGKKKYSENGKNYMKDIINDYEELRV